MAQSNPFTPTFGIVPPIMAGREELVEELSCAFANGLGDPNLCTILAGARGTGKTAGLSFIADAASAQGWIAAQTTAAEGLLVDEVKVSVDEMKQLARIYQHFVTEGRKVALLMAGLPHNVSQLLRDDDISFLRRSRKHHLGRIPDFEIREALRLTLQEGEKSMGPESLDEAVAAIDGFPYMMQLVGYCAWSEGGAEEELAPDAVRRGIARARKEMIDGVLEYTYLELSQGDKRFLGAMLQDEGESSLAVIAERMGVRSNYASQYKKRLLEQGIIGERVRGYLRFDMPVFREYLAERLQEEDELA